jgi:trans-aconitate methyltransferase
MSEQKQHWDPKLYDQQHDFVWKAAADLVDLLAPQPGERIADLGCGTGHLANAIAQRGAEVIGIDRSAEMLAEGRKLYPKLRFMKGDARSFALDAPVDAVFSNATLHWVKPPQQAARQIAQALKPGGRFVAEFGGYGNVRGIIRSIEQALSRVGYCLPNEAYGLWYYPSIAEYAAVLERVRLEVTYATLFDRPTPLEGPDGLRNWLRMFAGDMLKHVPPDKMKRFDADFHAAARPRLFRDGTWLADYRRLRIVAIKRA